MWWLAMREGYISYSVHLHLSKFRRLLHSVWRSSDATLEMLVIVLVYISRSYLSGRYRVFIVHHLKAVQRVIMPYAERYVPSIANLIQCEGIFPRILALNFEIGA